MLSKYVHIKLDMQYSLLLTLYSNSIDNHTTAGGQKPRGAAVKWLFQIGRTPAIVRNTRMNR